MYLKSFILPIQYEEKLMAEQAAKKWWAPWIFGSFYCRAQNKTRIFYPENRRKTILKRWEIPEV